MKLTENFYLSEFTESETALRLYLDNEPEEWQIVNIKNLTKYILQPLREYLNEPIIITSGYRSPALNERIGGALNSQHTKGMAADFKCRDNLTAFNFIKNELDFDQLIYEFGNDSQPAWVHASYATPGRNRGEVLRAIYNHL